MAEKTDVENTYCNYCRKLLSDNAEIKNEYHTSCHEEIQDFDSSETVIHFTLNEIAADFSDISCDINGNITYIDLSNKGLTSIPHLDNLKPLLFLEEINLASNYLSRVPSWIYDLPNLKKIIFPGNGFSKSLLLEILKLNEHGLEVISTGCTFSNNKIVTLNISFLGMPTTLSFPEDVTNYFHTLETLIMRQNNLVDLPDWVLELENLKNLNLSGNRFSRLNISIILKSKNLVQLNLAHNDLHYIPNWVCENKNLVELDLSNNPIQEISDNIFKLKKLKKIYLTESFLPLVMDKFIRKLEKNGIEVENKHYRNNFFWWGNE